MVQSPSRQLLEQVEPNLRANQAVRVLPRSPGSVCYKCTVHRFQHLSHPSPDENPGRSSRISTGRAVMQVWFRPSFASSDYPGPCLVLPLYWTSSKRSGITMFSHTLGPLELNFVSDGAARAGWQGGGGYARPKQPRYVRSTLTNIGQHSIRQEHDLSVRVRRLLLRGEDGLSESIFNSVI